MMTCKVRHRVLHILSVKAILTGHSDYKLN